MTALGVSEPDANGALLLETSDSGHSPRARRAFGDIHPFRGVVACLGSGSPVPQGEDQDDDHAGVEALRPTNSHPGASSTANLIACTRLSSRATPVPAMSNAVP